MWERVRTQGGTEGWIKQADISEDDGTPVKKIVYDRWDRFFTLIDLCKYGNYRCEKKDDFLKEFGLRLGESSKVSEAMKGHKELLLPVYYKKESEWLDSDELTNALISKYTMVRDAIMQERTDCEFWDGLNENLPRECYYFNPKGFLNHLDKVAGVPEFNPYESCILITPRYYKEQGKIELIDNPGFTTYSTATDNDKFPELLKIENKYYASINVGFNVHTTQRYDVHMGVDFPGQLNNEYKKVVALIHGKVWACTWNGSVNEASSGYGRVMIIKGDNNLLYLLAHLSTFLKKVGDEVFPGDDVAIAGNTGNSFGAHLHLEVHKTNVLGFDIKFAENILNLKGNHNQKEPNGYNGLLWEKGYDFKSARVNPFNHNEKFNGN